MATSDEAVDLGLKRDPGEAPPGSSPSWTPRSARAPTSTRTPVGCSSASSPSAGWRAATTRPRPAPAMPLSCARTSSRNGETGRSRRLITSPGRSGSRLSGSGARRPLSRSATGSRPRCARASVTGSSRSIPASTYGSRSAVSPAWTTRAVRGSGWRCLSSGHRSQLSRDIVHTLSRGVSDGDAAVGGHGRVGGGAQQE
jgi:hypothetical protein